MHKLEIEPWSPGLKLNALPTNPSLFSDRHRVTEWNAILFLPYLFTVPEGCPQTLQHGWIYIYGNRCYQFINSEVYWTEADTFCRTFGGHLVMVSSSV